MDEKLTLSKRQLLQGLTAVVANSAVPARAAAVVATAATQAPTKAWFIQMAWKFVMYNTRLDRHGIIGSAGAVDGFTLIPDSPAIPAEIRARLGAPHITNLIGAAGSDAAKIIEGGKHLEELSVLKDAVQTRAGLLGKAHEITNQYLDDMSKRKALAKIMRDHPEQMTTVIEQIDANFFDDTVMNKLTDCLPYEVSEGFGYKPHEELVEGLRNMTDEGIDKYFEDIMENDMDQLWSNVADATGCEHVPPEHLRWQYGQDVRASQSDPTWRSRYDANGNFRDLKDPANKAQKPLELLEINFNPIESDTINRDASVHAPSKRQINIVTLQFKDPSHEAIAEYADRLRKLWPPTKKTLDFVAREYANFGQDVPEFIQLQGDTIRLIEPPFSLVDWAKPWDFSRVGGGDSDYDPKSSVWTRWVHQSRLEERKPEISADVA